MKNTLLLAFLITTFYSYSQSPFQAPLNPDFISQKKKTGYVYPPYKVEHQLIKSKDARVLPTSYDLRDDDGNNYISAIRNQNPWGTCWTFAAIASIESNWKKNEENSTIDLSEANMAKCHGYIFDIDSGGNQYVSTAYLTRLAGPLYESSDPYENIEDRLCPAINKNTDIPAYADEVLWLGNDRRLIKQMIYDYGALATSMQADFSSKYYNTFDYTFYYNGTKNINHGVAIVGWDDDKVVTGGSSGSPNEKGAWIVRNSWGENAQDSGYFYASYEDKYIGKESELYYGKTPTNEIDTLFDYAELGAITNFRTENTNQNYAYAAVKYHSNKDVFLTYVGAAILEEGTTIDITLCRSFDGTLFSDTIALKKGITCYYAGYKKIEFPAIAEAGDFYLIVKYTTPSNYPIPAETVVEDYAYPEIEENVMWVSDDGTTWEEGGKNTYYDFDLAVKIYAKYINGLQAYFTSGREEVCIDQEVTFYNNSIGEADSFIWIIEDKHFVTTNKNENITYSFSEAGTPSITIKAYKDGIPSTFTQTNAVKVVSEIYPKILITKSSDYYSKGSPITLIGCGGDTYKWNAKNYLNDINGKTITFSPNEDELWVSLEATMGNCTNTDSILIKMIQVPYDNISEALQLEFNVTKKSISNQYATIESGEPHPPLDDCNSQSMWCQEGGLQNSIWFKFTAPNSGKAMINTIGFDNQIALYDAIATGSWEDIMSGNTANYNIIAANDDYNADYSAKIEEVSDLTPGKTYWIQMDGSAGGTTGEIDITLSTSLTTLESLTSSADFEIINSPSLCIIKGSKVEGSNLSVYNSIGQCIYHNTIASLPLTISRASFNTGFYLIRINNETTNNTFKTIAKQPWQLTIEER